MRQVEMNRALLLLDDDPNFIISAQKLFPKYTEWFATGDLDKVNELFYVLSFDVIVVRKKNEKTLRELIQRHSTTRRFQGQNPFKSLVVLPKVFWRKKLRGIYAEREK
jgi:hypothetical protein